MRRYAVEGIPSSHHNQSMAKAKTTMYMDEELLRAARAWAARKNLRDSDVMEQALRRFLGMDMLEQVWQRNQGVGEQTALNEAYAGVRENKHET